MKTAVCMATYNGQRFVKEQIDSILNQLGQDDYLFISDDASSDRTIELLEGYRSRVILVDSSRAGGVVRNFERVIQAAYDSNAEFFILADQDDVWLNGRIDKAKKCLEDYDLVLMNGFVVDESLNQTKSTVFEKVGFRRGLLKNLFRPTYVGCCMAFSRNVARLVLPFPRCTPWHDWLISLVGESFFSIVVDDEPLIYYRRHSGNASDTGNASSNTLTKKIWLRILIVMALLSIYFRKLSSRVF